MSTATPGNAAHVIVVHQTRTADPYSPFLACLPGSLASFRFRSGDYSTKFIAQEYPNGFHGVKLTTHETSEFIALAAAIHSARHEVHADVRQGAQQAASELTYAQARQQARQRHHLVASAAVPAAGDPDDDVSLPCCQLLSL